MAALTPQKLSIRKPLAGTPAPKFSDDLRVAWVPGAKPAGSISGDRYTQYSVAKTVGEAKKLGAKQADVKWDWDKGYMQLTDQQGVPLGGFAPPRAEEVAVPRPQKRERVEKAPQMTTPQKRAAPKPEKAEKTPALARPQPEVARKEVVVEPPPPAKRVRTLALPRILARAVKLRSLGLLPPLAAAAPAAEAPEEAPERTEEQQVEEAPMQVEEKTDEQLEVQQADGDTAAAQVDQEEEQQGEEPAPMEEPAEAAPEEPMQVDEQSEEPQEVQQADGETAAAQVDQEEEQQGEEPAPMEEPAPEEQQQEAEPTTEL